MSAARVLMFPGVDRVPRRRRVRVHDPLTRKMLRLRDERPRAYEMILRLVDDTLADG